MDSNTLIDSNNIDAFVPTHAFFIEKQAMGLIWRVDRNQVFTPEFTPRFAPSIVRYLSDSKIPQELTRSIQYKYRTHVATHYNVMLPVLTKLAHAAHLSYVCTVKAGKKDGEVWVVFGIEDERIEEMEETK
jgi:hypothetical protein